MHDWFSGLAQSNTKRFRRVSGMPSKDDGRLTSFCTWTEGIVSLLPRTDRIVFASLEREEAFGPVKWAPCGRGGRRVDDGSRGPISAPLPSCRVSQRRAVAADGRRVRTARWPRAGYGSAIGPRPANDGRTEGPLSDVGRGNDSNSREGENTVKTSASGANVS